MTNDKFNIPRVAALYDIHGNLPALEAVVREVRRVGVDFIVVGGDVVPGPMPRETLSYLADLDIPTRYLRGNGESDVLACGDGKELHHVPEVAREVIRWSAERLTQPQLTAIRSWPSTVRVSSEHLGDVLFCHATPRNNVEIFTKDTDAVLLANAFADANASLVVCGHTHMQFDRTVGGTRIVNAGSVGMPFGSIGAYWLLLAQQVELRRTTYDVDAAARRVRATSYPHAESFAARNILAPPTEREMLERFAKSELR